MLLNVIHQYRSEFIDENIFRDKFIELLKHPRSFFRDHLPGHITGSAWIIDESREFVLLTHHAKLNKWLQPGGHSDGDENVFAVAMREAEEETGLKNLQLLSNEIFDIDIHPIPARTDFPQHDHYDVRILIGASKEDSLIVTEESHDLQWIRLDDVAERSGNNQSMVRMVEKTRKLAM